MANEKFLRELQDAILEKARNADLREAAQFVIEESLYIALMADLFMVSGKVRAFMDDGITRDPLAAQRIVLTNVIIGLRKISQSQIPLTSLRPLEWATPLLESWEAALGDADDYDGVVYYNALPGHMRMFMTLGLPGMLRIAVQLSRQIVQLARG